MAVGTRDRDPNKLASPSDSLGLALDDASIDSIDSDDPSKAVNPSIDSVGYNPNEDSEVPNLLSLSNEVLVKIMFLSEARDKVKLRYVSP